MRRVDVCVCERNDGDVCVGRRGRLFDIGIYRKVGSSRTKTNKPNCALYMYSQRECWGKVDILKHFFFTGIST